MGVLGGHDGLNVELDPDDQVDDRVCALGDDAANLLVAARRQAVAPFAADLTQQAVHASGVPKSHAAILLSRVAARSRHKPAVTRAA